MAPSPERALASLIRMGLRVQFFVELNNRDGRNIVWTILPLTYHTDRIGVNIKDAMSITATLYSLIIAPINHKPLKKSDFGIMT
jgi:hypothetical protein